MRRWLVRAVALSLLLPALAGLLPQPAVSASAALDRDLLVSVCGQDRPPQQGGVPHDQAHDRCVLCGQHCTGCRPNLASPTPAFVAAPRQAAMALLAATRRLAVPLRARLAGSPPRGPPARA